MSSTLPDETLLGQVQGLAHRMGGLPALVAEIMGSYTGQPTRTSFDQRPRGSHEPVRPAAGRLLPGPADRMTVDLTLARVAVPMVARRPDRARLGVGLLEQLAADAAAHHRLGKEHHEAVAACLTTTLGDSCEVATEGDDTIVTAASSDRDSVLAALLRLTFEHRVVHARLRTATSATETTWSIGRWDTARRVSPQVVELFRNLVARPRCDDAVARSWAGLGLDADLRGDLLPTVDAVLGPLDTLAAPAGLARARAENALIAAVPDELGAVYTAAHLTSLSRLLTPDGRPAGVERD